MTTTKRLQDHIAWVETHHEHIDGLGYILMLVPKPLSFVETPRGAFVYDERDIEAKCSWCETRDRTVGSCDWCGKFVCLEHDDVLSNRDIDSDLTLCQPCGEKYDEGARQAVEPEV